MAPISAADYNRILAGRDPRTVDPSALDGLQAKRAGMPRDTGEIEAPQGKRGQHGRHRRGHMNKTEARYAQRLEARRMVGEIRSWKFESITLTLAPDCRYTPDFMVWHVTGAIEMVETKGGFMRDDARVKLLTAYELFPMFRWTLARYVKGEWTDTALSDVSGYRR